MRITALDVANCTGGTVSGNDAVANGISFDTRTLSPGQAFVAIVAERDGHEFVGAARDGGAAFAVVGRARSVEGITCVEVDDTSAAVTAIGHLCRTRLDAGAKGRVVGVTGSAGKTSTKDFLHAVLRSSFAHAHAAFKSFNNDMGVPVTMANAPDDCDAIVLEMGMRGFGEITRLCEVGRPDIGVVTIVGDAHGDRVGGIDGVARAKSELVAALPAHGIAVLNADDHRVAAMAQSTPARVVTYGQAEGSTVRFTIVGVDGDGCCTVDFIAGNESARATLVVPGPHMAANACAAVAVGLECGIPLATAVAALANVEMAGQRVQWCTSKSGIRILDDSYNANPSSMVAAFHTLRAVDATNHVAVLGAMAEISEPAASHRHVWQYACDMDIDVIALETDLYGPVVSSVDEAVAQVVGLGPGTVILVKGSRSARTERVVEALLAL